MTRREALGYLQATDPLLLQPQYPVYPGETRLGRDADFCQIILSRDFVSRQHCAVEAENGHVVLNDLGATNGTFVNGKRISRHVLEEGDAISLGKEELVQFIYSQSPGPRERILNLPPQAAYVIGRATDCDLPLVNDLTVSTRHARIRITGDNRVAVEDLGSANGTHVNGQAVKSALVGPQDAVRIGSAEMFFEWRGDGLAVTTSNDRNRLRLEVSGLGRTSGALQLLRNINLVIEPGEFVGVLGPSGAGKSTLLNALCGVMPANQGGVYLNGANLYDSYDMFRNAIGLVPQDDIIHRELTIEQSLGYTAQLRLPKDSTSTQIGQNVTSVIETLGLNHVRTNPVQNLSGGQRKRVSIGCELLTRPSLLFLDEPTSGLDPSTEEKLMKYFRQLAEQGQTVVVTTHILYSLDLIDLVVILSRGRLCYFGPVSKLCAFFSTPEHPVERPLDVFEVLEPEGPDSAQLREQMAEKFQHKYLNSPLFQEYVVDRATVPLQLPEGFASPVPKQHTVLEGRQAAGPAKVKRRIASKLFGMFDLRQLAILVKRMVDLKIAFPKRLAIPLGTPLILALLTATIQVADPAEKVTQREDYVQSLRATPGMMEPTVQEFAQQRFEQLGALAVPLSFPLTLIMTAVFLGTLSGCLEISSERSIYLRERLVNLRIPVYVAAKLPYLFLLTLVQAFIYVFLSVLLVGNLGGVDVLSMVLIVTVVSWVSCMVGLFISSLDPTQGENSVILAIVAVLPQMILCGAMGPGFYHGMGIAAKAVAAILPARWGFEWMLSALYQEPAWARDVITGTAEGQMGFLFGSDVYLRNGAVLAGLGIIYFIATCVSLKRYDRL